MDILNIAKDLLNFSQNPVLAIVTSVIGIGGASGIGFSAYKAIDAIVEKALRRVNPEKFLNRVQLKVEWFGDTLLKAIIFIDDKFIDRIKKTSPKTGKYLEDMIVKKIENIRITFNRKCEDAKNIILDK